MASTMAISTRQHRLARALQVHERRHDGAGEPEKLLDCLRRPLRRATSLQSYRNQGYVAVGSQSNNERGRGLPSRRDPRVIRTVPATAFLSSGIRILWDWRSSLNGRDLDGDPSATTTVTTLCRLCDLGEGRRFYGWPYSYIGKHYDLGTWGPFRISSTSLVADLLIPSHSAAWHHVLHRHAISAAISQRRFRALHGSLEPVGCCRVQGDLFPGEQRRPGPVRDFLTGFSPQTDNETPIQQWGRPVGVTVARDGALLVSDDSGNRIWKISATAGTR